MKSSLLTSASLSLLYFFSIIKAAEEEFDEAHLESLLADPKYKPNALGNVIPGRFIIEFEQDFHGSSLDFVTDIEADIIQTDPSTSSRIKMSIAHDFNTDSAIFRGISIALTEVDDAQFNKRQTKEEKNIHSQALQNIVLRKILQQNRVKHIYPVTEIQRPKVETLLSTNTYAFDESDNVVPKTPDLELTKDGPLLPFTHSMTQVNRVNDDLKFKGKGILVGIIDSGKKHATFIKIFDVQPTNFYLLRYRLSSSSIRWWVWARIYSSIWL